MNENVFRECLVKALPKVDTFIETGVVRKFPVKVSALREETVHTYPKWAIRELMMNAIMHRDYQGNAPVRLYQFKHSIEIQNHGGLYGRVRPENFPNINDYRNPIIAEAMKTLGYVNGYNIGIAEVQYRLKENGNPPAEFDISLVTAFRVRVARGASPKNVDSASGAVNGAVNGAVSGAVKLGASEVIVLACIKDESGLNGKTISERLQLGTSTVDRAVRGLKDKNLIEFRGSRKTGGYYPIEKGE